jgi:hypothetical protein
VDGANRTGDRSPSIHVPADLHILTIPL